MEMKMQYTYSRSNGCVYPFFPGENKFMPSSMVVMDAHEIRVYEDWKKAHEKDPTIKCPRYPLQGKLATEIDITPEPAPKKTRKPRKKKEALPIEDAVIVEPDEAPTSPAIKNLVADSEADIEDLINGANNS